MVRLTINFLTVVWVVFGLGCAFMFLRVALRRVIRGRLDSTAAAAAALASALFFECLITGFFLFRRFLVDYWGELGPAWDWTMAAPEPPGWFLAFMLIATLGVAASVVAAILSLNWRSRPWRRQTLAGMAALGALSAALFSLIYL